MTEAIRRPPERISVRSQAVAAGREDHVGVLLPPIHHDPTEQ